MGYYVAVQFSFSCNSLWRLKEIANNMLADSYKFEDKFRNSYTYRMLEEVALNTDKYIFEGNKGDMFVWGGIWNYYYPEAEIPYLKEFLKRAYNYSEDQESILFDFERALLIVNREQTEMSNLYEFSMGADKTINVRQAETDLCWNQY